MKNTAISYIRFISMLLIISCHILQGLEIKLAFWVNVGVQLFFFISGYLYGGKDVQNIKEFYISRIKKILLPTLYIYIVVLILEKLILNNSYSKKIILGNFLGLGGFIGNFSIVSHTWFISYILLCYFIIPVLQRLFSEKRFEINLVYLAGAFLSCLIIKMFNLTIINTSWINNYILGYFFSRCCHTNQERAIYKGIIYITFIIIIPFAVIYQEKINVNLPGFINSLSDVIIEYGHVFLGCVLFIALYDLIDVLKLPNNCILQFSDSYSFYIYLVHQIFILKSFSVLFCTKIMPLNILLIIVLSLIGGIILKLISYYIEKLFIMICNFMQCKINGK